MKTTRFTISLKLTKKLLNFTVKLLNVTACTNLNNS